MPFITIADWMKGLVSEVAAAHSAVRRAGAVIPNAVLVVGFLGLLWAALVVRNISVGDERADRKVVFGWDKSLIGSYVALPDGTMPTGGELGHRMIIASVSCAACAGGKELLQRLISKSSLPVVALISENLSAVPKDWGPLLRKVTVVSTACGARAPRRMIDLSPQVVLADATGRILDVPSENEDAAEFAARVSR